MRSAGKFDLRITLAAARLRGAGLELIFVLVRFGKAEVDFRTEFAVEIL